jgi:hypothetical protein
MAVASLVAGVVGLFSCFFPALALTAIAFGHVSLRQLKREADRERGRGLAVAGLVLGYATLLLSIGFWVLVATTDTTDTTDVPDPTPATSIAGFGSDPQLDALARDCEGGDFPACDRLWLQGTEGSSYEDYGDTCGGRQELSPDASSIFHERCTEAFPVES